MTNPGDLSRLHYMDAMRSVLMLLGVVLHSARPYDSTDWPVKDAQTNVILDGLTWTVHLFRMPAFFVVAGFFAMFLLFRRPAAFFLRERMARVGIPLLATLLSVNVLQSWYLGRSETATLSEFVERVLIPYWWSGGLIGHLWFLVCLAVYFLIVATFAPTMRRMAARQDAGASTRDTAFTFYLMLVTAILARLALGAVSKLAAGKLDLVIFGLASTSVILFYLPFFAVGAVLCARPKMLDRFARHDLSVIVPGLCAALVVYLTQGHEDIATKSLHIVSRSLLVWMTIRVVFSLFRRWANAPSRSFRYLSDASYSIYLFHHLVVVVVASMLLPVAIDAWAKFLIVLSSASIVSLAVHHFLILRYGWLRYLFNGRAMGRGRAGYPAPNLSVTPTPPCPP